MSIVFKLLELVESMRKKIKELEKDNKRYYEGLLKLEPENYEMLGRICHLESIIFDKNRQISELEEELNNLRNPTLKEEQL